jgi:hypothetical protein
MISWATTFMHSWGVCSDLRTNSFLRIMKKTAKCYGKYMVRLARISDQDDIENFDLVFVGALPPQHDQLMKCLLLPTGVAVFCTRVPSLLFPSAILKVSHILTIVIRSAFPLSWFFEVVVFSGTEYDSTGSVRENLDLPWYTFNCVVNLRKPVISVIPFA